MELLSHGETWVGIAFLLFVGLLFIAKVPAMAGKALDARAEKIQAELDEAQRLREEAQSLLASIKTQREQAEKAAADMIANAQAEAKRLEVEAKAKLEDQIKRRAELAERKIASAEAAAVAEVKAAAVELAASAAETVLAGRLSKGKSDPLATAAIEQLGAKLQ